MSDIERQILRDLIAEQRAEVERLRAALWQIDNGGSWEINQLRDIARRALEHIKVANERSRHKPDD